MRKAEALRFIRSFPRFNQGRGYRLSDKGTHMAMGFRRVPDAVDRAMRIIVPKGAYTETIETLRPFDVECFQSRLRYASLCFAIRHFGGLNRWKKARLPILIRFGRHLMVWNGTHRVFAAQLLDRPLRCRVFTIAKPRRSRQCRRR